MKTSTQDENRGIKRLGIRFPTPGTRSDDSVPIRVSYSSSSKPARRWFCGEEWLRTGVKAFTPAWCGALLLLLAGLVFAWPAQAQNTVVFDFDNGTPALSAGQNLPFDQTSGGVTAHFSTASTGFSVQNNSSNPSLILSLFSGNYLLPSTTNGILVIQFSQPITNISLDFATAEATPNEQPNPVRLTAFANSTNTPAVGSASKAGTYIGVNGQPMGNLSLASSTPFSLVTVSLDSGPNWFATGLMVDNITNWVSGTDHYTITTSSSPSVGGTTTGGGTYFSNAPVSVVATANPGYAFVNWTENGVEVSTLPNYDFAADSFRTLVANFVLTYDVVTSASPTAGGTTVGDGTYWAGATANVVATPNAGYAFVNWTDNGVPVSTWASYLFVVNSNTTVVANFAPSSTVAVSAVPANAGFTSGSGTYPSGASVTVAAIPKTGYSFVNWTENGQPVSSAAAYTFTAGPNRTLAANFTANPNSATFDLDTGAPALTNNQVTPFGQSAGGVTATFSATNDPAFAVAEMATLPWVLSRFTSNCLAPIALNSMLDIHLSQMVTNISLSFATLDFQDILAPSPLELTAYTNSTGTTAVGSTTVRGTYVPGDSMAMGTLSFSSATPFNVVRLGVVATPSGATDFVVDNINVLAVGSAGYTITATANPPAGGTITGAGTYNSGATVTLTAAPVAGYAFVDWTEGGNSLGTSPTLTFTATSNRTLVANFTPVWAVAVTANPTAGGTISGAGSYTNNASITLTASPANGYAFVDWTEGGNSLGTSPTLTFTATSSRTLVANFTQAWNIVATASAAGGGTVTGGGTYTNGAAVTVTAVPDADCAFVNWTEGSTILSAPATYTFTATANRTLVATFSPQLQILVTATNTAAISWSATSTGFTLQEATNCDGKTWMDSTNKVEVLQGRNQVIVPSSAPGSFYRLSHP